MPYFTALAIGALLGWWTTSNHWQVRYSEQQTVHADLLRCAVEANVQVIQSRPISRNRPNTWPSWIPKHIQELSDVRSENRRLEDLYSAADGERRRLRIEGIVARNDAIVSETTGADSVGDAASLNSGGGQLDALFEISGEE